MRGVRKNNSKERIAADSDQALPRSRASHPGKSAAVQSAQADFAISSGEFIRSVRTCAPCSRTGRPITAPEQENRPRASGDARGRSSSIHPRQNAVPLARLPAEEENAPKAVCSTKLPVAVASGLRFIDTPSVPLSDDG